MWAWLNNNYGALAALFQCLTLVVWTLYLQLFLSSVRHRTRPKVLINRGAGRSLDSRCIITNMSAEPVYVEAVVAALGLGKDRDGFTLTCSLGNIDRDQSQAGDPRSEWYQGPFQVAELEPESDHAFLMTKEGGLLYFHRSSMLSGDFDSLRLGDAVHYVEDVGDTGPIATKVRPA